MGILKDTWEYLRNHRAEEVKRFVYEHFKQNEPDIMRYVIFNNGEEIRKFERNSFSSRVWHSYSIVGYLINDGKTLVLEKNKWGMRGSYVLTDLYRNPKSMEI